jgi:hypothetical protein
MQTDKHMQVQILCASINVESQQACQIKKEKNKNKRAKREDDG